LEEARAAHAQGTEFYFLFLARAHQRLGHTDEARAWLAKAEQGIAQGRRWPKPGDGEWESTLELNVLRREASALIQSQRRAGQEGSSSSP
jgi:hypothetical protein